MFLLLSTYDHVLTMLLPSLGFCVSHEAKGGKLSFPKWREALSQAGKLKKKIRRKEKKQINVRDS